MVGQNMKVGDTFEDGGRAFKVLQVNGNGTYISQYIGKAEVTKSDVKKEEKPKVEEKAPEVAYTKTEINRMSTADLEKVCEKLGLKKSTGMAMKKAIIEKLGL